VDKQQVVFTGRIVSLTLDDVTLPNGKDAHLEIVHHPGGAAVVAVDAQRRVCLLQQYRHAFRKWLWELPAGKLDPGETPLVTAQRELIEEAGMKAKNWMPLGGVISSPGVFTEVVHLFLAEDLTPTRKANEEHELIEVHWVPLAEAIERAMSGEIDDGKTLAGLFRAGRYIKDKRRDD
jgi:8-oxo-dGTP pyrophosphatase MutT (NUDIX family)